MAKSMIIRLVYVLSFLLSRRVVVLGFVSSPFFRLTKIREILRRDPNEIQQLAQDDDDDELLLQTDNDAFLDDSSAEDWDQDYDCPMPHQRKLILIISDSTGTMAKSALRKMLTQFDSCQKEDDSLMDNCDLETKSFSFCRTHQAVEDIFQQYITSRKSTSSVMVLYTFADAALRAATARLCHGAQVASIDLLGPLFDEMGQFLNQTPSGLPNGGHPNRRKFLSSNYFRRVEAVEFTLQTDDGKAPWLLGQADVILVGVSRTGKTPLSVVLSHTMGLRVANIPLVLEVAPPAQLLNSQTIDCRRVFCLTLAPQVLGKIRANRLERRQVRATEEKVAMATTDNDDYHHRPSNYADRNYLLKDLVQARRLAQAQNWTEIDVTGRAVEETATLVVELLTERFPAMKINN